MRISELRCREVINICDCKRLGYVGDIDFDFDKGCIVAIIVPGPPTICGFLGREKEYIIPFCSIRQVGPDLKKFGKTGKSKKIKNIPSRSLIL